MNIFPLLSALVAVILIQLVFMIAIFALYLKLSKAFHILTEMDLKKTEINGATVAELIKTFEAIAVYIDKTDSFLTDIVPDCKRLRQECHDVLEIAEAKAAHITATSQAIRARTRVGEVAQQVIYKDGKPDKIISLGDKKEEPPHE